MSSECRDEEGAGDFGGLDNGELVSIVTTFDGGGAVNGDDWGRAAGSAEPGGSGLSGMGGGPAEGANGCAGCVSSERISSISRIECAECCAGGGG